MITGGTSGIGLAFAKALAARGCDLALVARNERRLREVGEQLGERFGVDCEILVADLGTETGVQATCARLAANGACGVAPIEILVNNAGQGLHHRLATTDTKPLEDAIALMATAVVRIGGAAGAAMKERGHGVIVNTASVAGLVPMGLYSAIKSFVKTWSESLTIELKPTVQVVTFMPGWVRTEFHERSGINVSNLPDFIWLDADDVAEKTLRAVDAGKNHVTPSLKFKVLSRLAVHGPRRAVHAAVVKINRGRGR